MTVLVVCGAGPHGHELADLARELLYEIVFLDDNPELLSVRGPADQVDLWGDRYVIGAAWPRVRRQVHQRVARVSGLPATLIHPAATISRDAHLAAGVVAAAGVRITNGTGIGAHTHIKVNATVSHSCQVGAFCTIAPGANIAGEVTIGDDVFIGVGAAIRNGISIGEGALVGAGAVVVRDVKPFETVYGNPARPR